MTKIAESVNYSLLATRESWEECVGYHLNLLFYRTDLLLQSISVNPILLLQPLYIKRGSGIVVKVYR